MKERYRDQRGLPFLDTTAQDLRYAIRVLSKNRGFATVAILSLAIGIGANAAIFSLVNGVLLQPLPYRDPAPSVCGADDGAARARRCFPGQPGASARLGEASAPRSRVWRCCAHRADRWLRERSRRRCLAPRVNHNFFTLLGVEPVLGRTFLPEEDQPGRDRVVILSESLWRSRFNGDPSWLGRSIVIDGVDHEVVGIVNAPFWRSLAQGRQITASNAPLRIVPAACAR